MAGTAEFDEYVMARSRHLLRTAYLLTGDHALAEDLLQTALAKSWSAWRRISGDPEPYVRKVLLNTYNSWWRRRWTGERPTDTLPEQAGPAPQAAVDDRDQVWRALSRLPRQQRMVLVLRYFEDLSEAEIAQTLGISAGSVKAHASRALASLRLDPSLRPLALPDGDDDVPAGNERLAAVRGRIAQRRRNRLASLAAACAVLLAGITGYAVAPWPRAPQPPTGPPDPLAAIGEYHDGYHVVGRGSAPMAQRTVRLVWTPTTLEAALWLDCGHRAPEVEVVVDVSVDSRTWSQLTCAGDGLHALGWQRYSPADLAAQGLSVGKPATVTMTVIEVRPRAADGDPEPGPSGSGAAASSPSGSGATGDGAAGAGGTPPDGYLSLLVGERAAFDEYPLPPRPAVLSPLNWSSPDPATATAVWLGQSGAKELVWGGDTLRFVGRSQTPGLLRVSVNGVPVGVLYSWDYEQRPAAFELDLMEQAWRSRGVTPGSLVTVTVEPKHVTGDWVLEVRHQGG
ncbi:SigE family RNA polymerase sigma factor [Catellatospora sp. NPDC049609]|uniref:SigE family RNA polymerase sigma factor n=1 Tax=Catellatospora sp. NPDC049609 TaxID=3155505 RepID=UPI003417323B